MKFTLSWLKQHLETDAALDAIVDKLTMIGLEVERVEDKGKALAPFSIARVISAEPHPNADRLRVCMVDTGAGEPVQVVCGAPNARAGMMGVFVAPGAFIPGKAMTLGVGTIRGVESRGMLCSELELEISDDHDGIIELPPDAPLGAPYAQWAGLDDPVIEINLTPNRPDCTGVHGIARDLAAADIGTLKETPIKPIKGEFPCPVAVTLDFGATPALCRGFALRLVRGVKNGPSPPWLQRRLIAIGLRPINALVDITNLITFDRGRPLHVFDAAKVKGNLVVRRGRAGETLTALDGKTYGLDDTMCVIADDTGPESLAGIMGGEATGCLEATTDVLIESAVWDELNIAQTGRKLGINSDARYRFERGVDPSFMLPGLELATTMVLNLCGGTPSANMIPAEPHAPDRVIDFPTDTVKRLAGVEVGLPELKRVLARLGFFVAGQGNSVKIAPPSWRPDVHGRPDIVEEVVRIIGVDRIPSTPFDRGEAPRKPVLTLIQQRTRKAKRALAARGLVEAVTWSFIAKPQADLFGGGRPELALANPIAADLSDMRPSLVPGLLAAAQRNADRGIADVGLFEVGQIFRGDQPADQLTAAAGVRRARARASGSGRHWSVKAGEVDAFDVKGDALAALVAAGAPVGALQITPGGPSWLHPGRSGSIQIGPQNVLGHFGELHPRALEALRAEGPLVAFEVILERIPEPKPKATRAKPVLELSPLQPVERDFAFVVDRTVKAADIVRAALSADRKLVAGVTVFDVYEGQGIEAGKKSIAIAVTLRPREKTMTDQEIDAVAAKIVAEVVKRTGGILRVGHSSKEPALMLKFNEGKACDAVVRVLEAREKLSRSNMRWPEQEGHMAPVEIAFNLGSQLFALEHTGIEPFPGHLEMENRAKQLYLPITDGLKDALGTTELYELHIPVNVFQNLDKHQIAQIQTALIGWVKATAPGLAKPSGGRGTSAGPATIAGVPFQVSLFSFEPIVPGLHFQIRHIVENLDQARTERMRKAIDDKLPKLATWKNDEKAKTILVLEQNDIQLTNPGIVTDLFVPLARARTDRPDETYLVASCLTPWHVFPILIGDQTYYDIARGEGTPLWQFDPNSLVSLTTK